MMKYMRCVKKVLPGLTPDCTAVSIHCDAPWRNERNKMVILSPSHYYYSNDSENYTSKSLSHSSSLSSQPSSLPYLPSGYPDLRNEYNNEQRNSRKKKEMREVHEEDTVV